MPTKRVDRVVWSDGIRIGQKDRDLYDEVLRQVWDILKEGYCKGPDGVFENKSQNALWTHFRKVATRAVTKAEINRHYPPKKIIEDIDSIPELSLECRNLLKRFIEEFGSSFTIGQFREFYAAESEDFQCNMGEFIEEYLMDLVALAIFLRKIPDRDTINRDCRGLASIIYLCPERIYDSADRHGVPRQDLLTAVWIHELCHSCTVDGLGSCMAEHFAQTMASVILQNMDMKAPIEAMVRLSSRQPAKYTWFKDGRPSKPGSKPLPRVI